VQPSTTTPSRRGNTVRLIAELIALTLYIGISLGPVLTPVGAAVATILSAQLAGKTKRFEMLFRIRSVAARSSKKPSN